MKRLLARWLQPSPAVPAQPASPERVAVDMHWRADTRLPIPDWRGIGDDHLDAGDDAGRHLFWTSAARTWLESLARELGPGMAVRDSEEFLLLSPLPERTAQLFLRSCERMRARIRRNLGALADAGGWGKHVAIVFGDHDAYYRYVSHYEPEDGEYAMSSGMFVQAGYGHFAMPQDNLEGMEPVIAHELTHCMLQHLPIPAWLNEGLAVNTEHAMFPYLADPRAQLYRPDELAAQHAAYWNSRSIQDYWSGRSFLAPDDGSRLSYDLAARMTALAARDDEGFRAFVQHADMADAGRGAEAQLGFPVANLAHAILGEGEWEPDPACWVDGVERGQFRSQG